MGEFRTILFIELLGGIGDIVIALPAIHALARSHPTAKLKVLTFAPGSELLAADPWIDRVICAPSGQARQAVDALLGSESFDLIVSDTNYDGIGSAIEAYQSTSSHHPVVITNLWRSPPDDERVGDRFLSILKTEKIITEASIQNDEAQIYLTAIEGQTARQPLEAAYRPLIVLYPDAGMPIKQWSVDNFITLGQALQQQYGATVIVPIGSDPQQAEQIVQGIGGTAQVLPRGSLRQLAATLAQADLMIAADTGSARIAAALNIPTITLFGPSWHGRYGQPSPHINLQGYPTCPERLIRNFTEQRCWYSGQCPFDWRTCLDDISPPDVLKAATHLLNPARLTPSSCPSTPLPFSLPSSRLQNILVMRLDNIGDVIMTSPVFRALRQNLPDATITLMASPSGTFAAPLLPGIDRVLPWRVLWQDLGRLDFDPDREWRLIETLKAHQFDAALILTSFSQSPHPAALLCALAGIPVRIGESKEQDSGTLTHAIPPASDQIHQVDRNLRLVEAMGFAVTDRRLSLHPPDPTHQTVTQIFKQHTQPSKYPDSYLLLNPWTTCQSRNYDPDRFATAARQLSEMTGWTVVVTGTEKDRQRSRGLLEKLGDCALDLVGKTSLSELVALVAEAKLVLTNNTSTMHIAEAMQTPQVVLFAGTEQESQWQPRYSPFQLLRRDTVCSPCYAFECPYQLQCLDIDPAEILTAALRLLQMEWNTSESKQTPELKYG